MRVYKIMEFIKCKSRLFIITGSLILLMGCTNRNASKGLDKTWDSAVFYAVKMEHLEKFNPGYFVKKDSFHTRFFYKGVPVKAELALGLEKMVKDSNSFEFGNLSTCFDECAVVYYKQKNIQFIVTFSCNLGQVHSPFNYQNRSVLKNSDSKLIDELYKMDAKSYQK